MAESNGIIVMLDPRRNQAAERKKLYEEMLLKEIPGTSRPNEPMHAVLEAELAVSNTAEGQAQHVRNHALIHYLATLATSNDTKDTFDFDFVESLLNNGANINSKDKTGQTVFHEVARSWNVDVASFLIKHGANVNQQDDFGRSPLHVAAAVDFSEMVEFLLQNGAEIGIKTKEEEQTPVHFAAKNDAINSLHMLLGYGADIDARDSKNRTPLQVSAEMNRSKAAKLLIKEGAPTGVYDNLGNCALSLLIEKIPEVALEAMDQFHSTDTINRKEFYFLNYLEGPKLKEQKTPARTPLEIAVQNERFDVILHPVMQRLIGVKWQMYGKWGAILDLVINLFYSVLWTVLGITLPKHGRDLYLPIGENSWRLTMGIIVILLTILEIRKQITNTLKTRQALKKWKEWRAAELERDIQYCHPRWPQETQYLRSEIKAVRNLSLISGSDMWIYFDWVALVLILATIISHVTFFHFSTDTSKDVHHYIIIPLLLILWFRIFKYARPFESAGPFVVIFGSVLGDIVKWFFLNAVIIVPFTCAFWITFGAISLTPVKGYDSVGPLVYNMFSMMVVNDHGYENLEQANPVMARILCGGFIGIAAIVTLNLLIALLTNTFERLYENAVANAVMQRARTILLLQKSLRKKQKHKYYEFIKKSGSPEVVRNNLGTVFGTERDDHATIDKVREDIKVIMEVLGEQFGKKYGKKKKSTLDFVKIDVGKVKRFQEELVSEVKNMKAILEGVQGKIEPMLEHTSHSNHNNQHDNNGNDGRSDNDDNNNNNDNNKVPTSNKNEEANTKASDYKGWPIVIKKKNAPISAKKIGSGAQKLGDNSEEDSGDDSESEETDSGSDDSDYLSKKARKRKESIRKKSLRRGSLGQKTISKADRRRLRKLAKDTDEEEHTDDSSKRMRSRKESLQQRELAYPPQERDLGYPSQGREFPPERPGRHDTRGSSGVISARSGDTYAPPYVTQPEYPAAVPGELPGKPTYMLEHTGKQRYPREQGRDTVRENFERDHTQQLGYLSLPTPMRYPRDFQQPPASQNPENLPTPMRYPRDFQQPPVSQNPENRHGAMNYGFNSPLRMQQRLSPNSSQERPEWDLMVDERQLPQMVPQPPGMASADPRSLPGNAWNDGNQYHGNQMTSPYQRQFSNSQSDSRPYGQNLPNMPASVSTTGVNQNQQMQPTLRENTSIRNGTVMMQSPGNSLSRSGGTWNSTNPNNASKNSQQLPYHPNANNQYDINQNSQKLSYQPDRSNQYDASKDSHQLPYQPDSNNQYYASQNSQQLAYQSGFPKNSAVFADEQNMAAYNFQPAGPQDQSNRTGQFQARQKPVYADYPETDRQFEMEHGQRHQGQAPVVNRPGTSFQPEEQHQNVPREPQSNITSSQHGSTAHNAPSTNEKAVSSQKGRKGIDAQEIEIVLGPEVSNEAPNYGSLSQTASSAHEQTRNEVSREPDLGQSTIPPPTQKDAI